MVTDIRTDYYMWKYLPFHTKEIGIEVNAGKTKYMIMSRDQNAGRSHSVKIDNNCKGGRVQIFGKNVNTSKFCSGRY